MPNDPLNPRENKNKRRSAEVDGLEISNRRYHHAAIKQMMRGAGTPEITRNCWKRAEQLNRSYVKLDDLIFETNTSFRFRLLNLPLKQSGISQRAGVYLDGFPKKLVQHYEEWAWEVATLEPGCIPVLVFAMPFLKSGMAVLREGTVSGDGENTGRFVYTSQVATYVIESCETFGKVSADYW